MSTYPDWPVDLADRLRALWPTHSAGAIGALLSKTRSSVIGKANRMKLQSKETPKGEPEVGLRRRGKGVLAKTRPRPPKGRGDGVATQHLIRSILRDPPSPELVDLPHDQSDCAVSLVDLTPEHCRYPLWPATERSGLYCGAVAIPDRSFCPRHAKVVYALDRMR